VTVLLRVLVILLPGCFPAYVCGAALQLQPVMSGVVMAPYLTLLEDPGATLTIGDVRSETWKSRFVPLAHDKTAYGVSASAWWVRLEAHNATDQPIAWLLDVLHNTTDYVDSYQIRADGTLVTQLSGDHRPIATGAIPSETFHFTYLTQPGSTSEIYLRFRYASAGIINVYQEASTTAAYAQAQHVKAIWLGGFLGAALLVILYNLFLMLSIREAPFYWYLPYVSSATVVYLALSGLGYRYLWGFSQTLADSIPIMAVVLFYTLAVQFSRSFLDTKARARRFDRLLQVLMLLTGCSGVLFFLGLKAASINLLLVIGLALGLFPVLGAWLWYQGHQVARGYTLAWTIWSLTVIGAILRYTGIMPSDSFSIGATRFGLISQTVLLAFALADRINILRNEKISAEKRELRASIKSRAELEIKVRERTQELEYSRRKAEVLAREDSLTGLLNRRAFFERGNQAVAQARRGQYPLSVIMLDIDRFKAVNDGFGHGVGDKVIRVIAITLTQVLRDSDIKSRLGGEEFAVVLRQTSRDAALMLAERLRVAIEQCSVKAAGTAVGVTSSFGVAQLTGEMMTLEDLLASADAALYHAKNSGRNRVVAAALTEPESEPRLARL
jgi:diguanylate cyclase